MFFLENIPIAGKIKFTVYSGFGMTSIHAKSVQTKTGTETELAQHIFMGCPQRENIHRSEQGKCNIASSQKVTD